MTDIIHPKDKEAWLKLRTEDITSTDIAALFNVSPYITLYELWHRKKDKSVVEIKESDRMKWGSRLESAIARGIAEDNGWNVEPLKCYMRNSERMGSSFDFAIDDNGILEIKNVDSLAFRDGWTVDEDGNIEAPPHIELQVQHQLAVSGRSYAYIGALVGGNYVALMRREPDTITIKAIKSKVKEFWDSIANNKEPAPNFERDYDFIRSIYQHAEPEKTIDANNNIDALVMTWRDLKAREKEIERELAPIQLELKATKAKLLIAINDAEKVNGKDYKISAGTVAASAISYTRESYRDFRISFNKTKGKS